MKAVKEKIKEERKEGMKGILGKGWKEGRKDAEKHR